MKFRRGSDVGRSRDRESDRRRRLAAEQFNKPVVSSATADRSLAAELAGNPFENGEVVVVQSAYHARVHAESDAGV